MDARPLLWARLSVRHTKKTFFGACLLPIIAVVLIVALKLFNLSSNSGDDYFIKSDLRSQLEDARTAARREYPFDTDTTPSLTLREKNEGDSFTLLIRNTRPGGTGKNARAVKVDVKKSGKNLLTREGLAFLKAAEDRLMNTEGFNQYCWLDEDNLRDCQGRQRECAVPTSITNHPDLYGVYSNTSVSNTSVSNTSVSNTSVLCDRSNATAPVSQEKFDKFLNSLVINGNVDPQWSIFFGSDFSSTSRETQILRSFVHVGWPFANSTDPKDKNTEKAKVDRFLAWSKDAVDELVKISTATFHVSVLGSFTSNLFETIVLRDLSLAGFSVILVFLVIWIHTTSGLLAGAALLQILLAFPLTYFAYRAILQVKYFAALQIMTIFLILGIGADDVFVFTDAWKQSGVVLGSRSSLEQRMSWTYRRAVKAMAVTSFTTAAAFFVTAVSPIIPISTLGIWAGVLVLLQFLLVCTMYPSAIIVWHRFWRVRTWLNCLKAPPPEFDEDEESPPAPDSAYRVSGDIPPEENSPAHWVGANGAVSAARTSADVAPPGTEGHWMGEAGTAARARQSGDIPAQENSSGVLVDSRRQSDERGFASKLFGCFSVGKRREDEYRPIEKFFHGPWTKWMNLAKFPLIVLGALLIGGSIYCATQLESPVEVENFLPPDHPVLVAFNLVTDAFPVKDSYQNVNVKIVWGLEGIDRSGTSKYNTSQIGKVVLDEKFSLRTKEAQQRILEACQYFENEQTELLDNQTTIASERSSCWIKDFKKWRKGVFIDYPSEINLARELISFGNATVDGKQPYYHYLEDQRIGFRKDESKVIFTELNFVARIKTENTYSKMWPEYRKWIKALEQFNNATQVESVKRPFAVGGFSWKWQMTQKALVDNMFLGIGVVLAVALVALTVSTGNWIVSFLALISISGILTNLLALLFLLGWTLGITESVGVVIAVGFSFDFVAHVANAYVETEEETRVERTRGALTDLGISIIAGAISTLLAGAMLFFATIIFFFKFGIFVVSTIALSLIWGLAFFPCLLLAVGPTGSRGNLLHMFGSVRRSLGFGRKNVSDDDFTITS